MHNQQDREIWISVIDYVNGHHVHYVIVIKVHDRS